MQGSAMLQWVMRVAPQIELSDSERQTLQKWARGRSTPARLVLRAKIVLLAAEGVESQRIAADLGTSRPTVRLWRGRFAESRIAGIEKDAARPGRPRTDWAELEKKNLEKTTQTTPENATQWSTRTLATELGVEHVPVHRVWKTHCLQ